MSFATSIAAPISFRHAGRYNFTRNLSRAVSGRSTAKGNVYFPQFARFESDRRLSIASFASSASEGLPEGSEAVASGEWPETLSLLNFEDLSEHYKPMLFKENVEPENAVSSIMIRKVKVVKKTDTVGEIRSYFESISGMPVVDDEGNVEGVLSTKDVGDNGPDTLFGKIFSSPAVTISPDTSIAIAAGTMLKHKCHRLPIVSDGGKLLGLVTRTDLFNVLLLAEEKKK